MSKVNTTLEDNIFARYSVIILGMLINALGVNIFLKPAHLLSGGVVGVSIIVNHITALNVGLATLILNIPIFIIGFMFLNKDFMITSLVNTFLYSFILGITQDISNYIVINDLFIQTIYGGLLCGAGWGLVFKTKSSLGGTDIIAAIIKMKTNVPIKTTSLSINFVIVLIGSFIFGPIKALYTLVNMFVNTSTMNVVKDLLNNQQAVMLISNKSEEIAKEIMTTLVRGVTFLEAEGAYTHEKKKIIYCIVATKEIPKVKEIAFKHDQRAFISVNHVDEVKGRGFKEKFL